MKRRDLYAEALGNMETTVHDLSRRIDPPVMTTFARTAYGFRYAEQGARQAIVQKMARVVSGLRAALLLLEQGYIQEQAAVCRMVDEACEDVSFLALGLIVEETDLHRQFLQEFFLEDFETLTGRMRRGSSGQASVDRGFTPTFRVIPLRGRIQVGAWRRCRLSTRRTPVLCMGRRHT